MANNPQCCDDDDAAVDQADGYDDNDDDVDQDDGYDDDDDGLYHQNSDRSRADQSSPMKD